MLLKLFCQIYVVLFPLLLRFNFICGYLMQQAMTGITVGDDVVNLFNDFKLKRTP